MNIQWFPGHMSKSFKLIKENLKLVDCVIELRDARIPYSSRNPEIENLLGSKKRIIVFNKEDLADTAISQSWKKYFLENKLNILFVDLISGKGLGSIKNTITNVLQAKIFSDKQKGRIFRPVRTMVIGIPNVGKSTFINRIAGKNVTAIADRPGVTTGKQWIKINPEIELLDTPGILWPKFENELVALNLAYSGAIRDQIIDIVEIAGCFLEKIKERYPEALFGRYGIDVLAGNNGIELLELIGRRRGCIISAGEVDLYRTAGIVLDEFRAGKLGRITLEKPSDIDIYNELNITTKVLKEIGKNAKH